jgi:hypothetical protein
MQNPKPNESSLFSDQLERRSFPRMLKYRPRSSDLKTDIPVIYLDFKFFREIVIKGDQKFKVFVLMNGDFCGTSTNNVNER